MPILSSDDDSDRENSHGSGDDRGGDRRASSSGSVDGGARPNPDVQSAVPTRDAMVSSAEEGAQPRVTSIPLPQLQEVFFTTTDFYLALRMHHLLAERLAEARRLCREAGFSRQTVVASPHEVRVHIMVSGSFRASGTLSLSLQARRLCFSS